MKADGVKHGKHDDDDDKKREVKCNVMSGRRLNALRQIEDVLAISSQHQRKGSEDGRRRRKKQKTNRQ